MPAVRLRDLLPSWSATTWEARRGGAWVALAPCSAVPLAAISAWNPGARRHGGAANRDRDAALTHMLRRLVIPHRRCRGRLGRWCEEAWLVPDGPHVPRLLAAWGQLAAQRWDCGGPGLRLRCGTRLALPRQKSEPPPEFAIVRAPPRSP